MFFYTEIQHRSLRRHRALKTRRRHTLLGAYPRIGRGVLVECLRHSTNTL